MKKYVFLLMFAAPLIFSACNKSEEFKTDAISDFAPLVIGKYIIYNLDSLIFASNSIPYDRVIKYQIKQEVMDVVKDNLGRSGFSIRRSIRKSGTDDWQADNTFFAINTGTTYEYIENNLRYLKLTQPIKNSYSWKGNSYIDTYSANSNTKYLDSWDYTYDSLNTPLTLGSIKIPSSVKVLERNDVLGDTTNRATYSEINFSASNYGRGIGLVYYKFLHQEYQPPTPGTFGYKLGYGITLTMIDHN